MAAEEPVGVYANLGVTGKWARANLDAPPRAGFYDRAKLNCGRQSNWRTDRGQRLSTSPKEIAGTAIACLGPEHAQRVQTQPPKGIGQVNETEVLHPATLRECRSFHRQPLDLSDKKAFVNGNEQISVDSRERPRRARIQRDRLRRFDIEGDLDFIRRDEVDRPDAEALRLFEGLLAHFPASPSLTGSAPLPSLSFGPVPQRAFKSSAIRNVVRSMAGFGR